MMRSMRLRRVVGVEGREHEVARFGRGDRGRHRLGRAHLAYHEHVDILAEHRLERRVEVGGVDAHLALVDERFFIFKKIFYRVFDGDDVLGALVVYFFYQRRERRCLALPHRPHHQKESLLARGKTLQDRRQVKLGDRADGARDEPSATPTVPRSKYPLPRKRTLSRRMRMKNRLPACR